MTFLDLVNQRQSCRAYLETPVEREKLERCLEAARLAPSACNSQPWRFIVVDEPELRRAVAQETFGQIVSFNHFTMDAPVLILIVSEPPALSAKIGGLVKQKPYHLFDIGIAAEHFCLQATAEGLGSCMLGWFNEGGVKKLLKIPRQKRVELIITLGYPQTNEVREKARKEFGEVVSFNSYKTK